LPPIRTRSPASSQNISPPRGETCRAKEAEDDEEGRAEEETREIEVKAKA